LTKPAPSIAALFGSFFLVGISGFGFVLPWARRMIVEQRQWLDAEGFNDLLSLCQLMPGPNMCNVCTVLGDRFQGPLGSIAAVTGLLSGPMVVVMVLGAVLARISDIPVVAHAFHGLGAAAAGLVVSTTVKIARPLAVPRAGERRNWLSIAAAVLAFIAIGLLRLPLLWCLAILLPLSVGLQLARARR
jgi:chromate transporter